MAREKFPLEEQLQETVSLHRVLVERPELDRMPDSSEILEQHDSDMSALMRTLPRNTRLPDMEPTNRIAGKSVAGKAGEQRLGDMTEPDAARSPDEGYVRVRVHVEDGELTITSVSRVEGPLVTTSAVSGGYVWEVVVGGERLASDALGDLSHWRSFAQPDGPEELRGHHIVELGSFDFTVRIPSDKISTESLDNAEIGLFRVKDTRRPLQLDASARPLREQFPTQLREVVRVAGIGSAIPQDLRGEIDRILGG